MRYAACFVILAFFACCTGVAEAEQQVHQLGTSLNTLENHLRHNPPELDDGDYVHNFGNGFYVKESHVHHIADHVGQHLRHAASHLHKLAQHAVASDYGSKQWMDNEAKRYHAEEGSTDYLKRRARTFIEGRSRNQKEADMLWEQGNAEDFYENIGKHDPEVYQKAEYVHAVEDVPEYQEAVSDWDKWMADPKNKALVESDEYNPPEAHLLESDENDLGEDASVDNSANQWKMPASLAKANFKMDHDVALPKQAGTTAVSHHTGAHSHLIKKLRSHGFSEAELQRMVYMLDIAKAGTHPLGESQGTGAACSPGQCAGILRDHIIDTTAEIAKLTGRPVPAAPTGKALWSATEGGKGSPQELPAPKGGGKLYTPPPSKKITDPKLLAEMKAKAKQDKDEPQITIGTSREDLKNPTVSSPEPITRDDVRGQMMDAGTPDEGGPVEDKPESTQDEPPAPPYTPPPAPEEMPPGCPLEKKRDTCTKMKFMGPFACWSMGQGEHSMPGEGAGADFRTIMRDNDFYPHSKKLGYLDLADFRWRFTAGKCMWWNQLFRSMNEPLWLSDTSASKPKEKGGYKVLWMCMIYAFATSRHWTAHNDGAFWPIMVVKGMMQEFGLDKKGPVKSERGKLVDALKHLNGDIIGSVWTYLYELGMSPCVNYIVIMAMLMEALIGMMVPVGSCNCGAAGAPPCNPAICPTYVSKPTCLYKKIVPPLPLWNCFTGAATQAPDCKRLATGKCNRLAIASPIGMLASGAIVPLAMFKTPASMAQKLLDAVMIPIDSFRMHFNNFMEFKFAMSDPLDVIWIHGGDVIGILEILFMIPIPPIQSLFEGLIKGLKLVPVMTMFNKALGFVVDLVFKNPIMNMIIKGPKKLCEMVLSAFVNNPIAKGLKSMFGAFMKLLDKPIKFKLFRKKFCFTVLGILKKVEKMFKMILDKVMGMVKAVLGPVFKLIDSGLKKIAGLIKLPGIPGFGGIMGKSGNLWTMLKETGAFDNPFTAYAACAWNLPWVQESGQNLCNCCLFGWVTSQPANVKWEFNDLQEKKLLAKVKTRCSKYGEDQSRCILKETDKAVPLLQGIFMPTCVKTPLGGLTIVGKKQYDSHLCIDSKAKTQGMLKLALVFIFKGFMCRFLNVGINPKVMMQLSPLPPISLFRRRRAGSKSTTPGMDMCKEYLKGKKKSKDGSKDGAGSEKKRRRRKFFRL